jgi:hypothetical protein
MSKYQNFKLATNEQAEGYVEEAKDWLENSPSAVMFSSAKGVSTRAIAEYLANQDERTLYQSFGEEQ